MASTQIITGGGGDSEHSNDYRGDNDNADVGISSLIDIAVPLQVSVDAKNRGGAAAGAHALRVPQPLLRSTLHESEVAPEAGAVSEQPELSQMKRINDELAANRRNQQQSGRHVAFASHSDHIGSEQSDKQRGRGDNNAAAANKDEDDDEKYTENSQSGERVATTAPSSSKTAASTQRVSHEPTSPKHAAAIESGGAKPQTSSSGNSSNANNSGTTAAGKFASALKSSKPAALDKKDSAAPKQQQPAGFVNSVRRFVTRHKVLVIAAILALIVAGFALFFFVRTQVNEKRRRAEQAQLVDLHRQETNQTGHDRALQEAMQQNALLVRQQQETTALLEQYERQMGEFRSHTDVHQQQYEALTAQYAEQQQQLAEYADYIDKMEKFMQQQEQQQQQEQEPQQQKGQEHQQDGEVPVQFSSTLGQGNTDLHRPSPVRAFPQFPHNNAQKVQNTLEQQQRNTFSFTGSVGDGGDIGTGIDAGIEAGTSATGASTTSSAATHQGQTQSKGSLEEQD
jgi:hypothetical protein